MVLKRRDFLKSVGLAAVGLGLWDSGVLPRSQAYSQALAQPARRKLALLVGIDRHGSAAPDCPDLRGCVTDVTLQRQLLIHRFGFQPQDIVTLTNEAATRSAIETTFLTHLVQQAQPNDLVLFHFSGYGSEVQPLATDPSHRVRSLVAADSYLPASGQPVQDLPLATLDLLRCALTTDRVITVLDAGHPAHPQSVPLGVRWRSRSRGAVGAWDPAIVAFQEKLQAFPLQGHAPGLLFQGAVNATPALEIESEGFSVGVLTASLTQTLWHSLATSGVAGDWQRILLRVQAGAGLSQQATFEGSLPPQQSLSNWGWTPIAPTGFEGVITALNASNGELRLWLGGIDLSLLRLTGARSQFTVVEAEAESDASTPGSETAADSVEPAPLGLKLQWRDRLEAGAYLVQGYPEAFPRLAVGQGIQEYIRWVPRNPTLTIGLEPQLDRIERVDATSAFAAIAQVDAVSMGDRAVDYIFGRLQALQSQVLNTNPDGSLSVSNHRYGLCPPGQAILSATISSSDEAVKTAVQRLEPRFRSLIALKLLRSLVNTDSTRLPLKLELKDLNLDLSLSRYVAERSPKVRPWFPWRNAAPTLQFQLSSTHSLRYQPQNLGDRPLYALLIAAKSDGSFALGYPPSLNTNAQDAAQSWTLSPVSAAPSSTNPSSLDWVFNSLTSEVELFCVVSTAPFTRTLKACAPAWDDMLKPLRLLGNAWDVFQALLGDLQEASQGVAPAPETLDAAPLAVSHWAVVRLLGHA
ncbi:MAG: caspase family protein [Prochlorothrix sp.]